MSILALTNMYPTATEPWYGSFVRDQITALQELGAPLEIYSFDGRRHQTAYLYACRHVRRRVRLGDIKLIHAHYGLSGAVALTQRQVPVITTFHGSDMGYIRWQATVSRFVAKRSTPIFVSKAGAQKIADGRGFIIPEGVDIELFLPVDPRAARGRLGWDPERIYVLLPGARSNPVKGAALFDQVIERLKATESGITPVSLEGFPRARVPDVMNATDCVLMTSEWEGSPVAIKEALACLTPAVSVEVGDIAEVLDGLPACAVLPRDPDVLAEGVRQSIGLRPAELRTRAESYSWQRVARQVAEVYEHVLGEQ